MTIQIDLIIPALNEAANVAALFDALEVVATEEGAPALPAAPPRTHGSENRGTYRAAPPSPSALERRVFYRLRHIIIADNGSTDGTPELAAARGAVVVREPQRGYGAACLKAIEWIQRQPATCTETWPPDVIVFLDADLADDSAALPRLLEPLARDEAEIAIGSRVKLAEPGALNFVQRFGNGLACWMMRVLTGRAYTDLGPFRAVRWSTLQRLRMADRTWGWTVEMQMKAALMDIVVAEVDVPYRRRRAGKSKISGTVRGVMKAGSKIIITIIALWLRRKRIGENSPQRTRSGGARSGNS